MSDAQRRWLWISLWSLLAAALLIAGALAWSARSVVSDLGAARDDLLAAQEAVRQSQPEAAKAALADAAAAAQSASGRLDGPLWRLAGALPVLGEAADLASAVSSGLTQALTALQPLATNLDVIDPSRLVTNGQINLTAVQDALPAIAQAQPGVAAALTTIQDAPTDTAVSQLNDAAAQLEAQLTAISGNLAAVSDFGKVAGPLLGANGEKRYFLGILNPNEARGTGGFLGTYAILRASDGQVSIEEVGSNTDLPTLEKLPAGLGKDFVDRYRDDPTLVGNMNMSPHFPSTAKIWLAAWEQKTGQRLDGAIAADVYALGSLVAASGQPVALPNGGTISGAQLGEFALRGIYEQFPEVAQAAERKQYQEAVTASAIQTVTAAPKPQPMAEALGRALGEGRVVVWTSDPELESTLIDFKVAGMLDAPEGHHVQFVAINGSGSKLDAYLSRDVTYTVGRCPTKNDQVKSSVTVNLRSDVPLGLRPPAYMMGDARQTPRGPYNLTFAQLYLPKNSEVTRVRLNGKEMSYLDFTERDRPGVLVPMVLPPRERQELIVDFVEPASEGPGVVRVQPLASPQPTTVIDAPCSSN